MTRRYIDLFMWGYQEHFRLTVKSLMRDLLKKMGADVDVEVLLVGARKPGSNKFHQVCIEPETGKWPTSIFEGLLENIEFNYTNHELKDIFYTDEASMREKPESMRRDAVRVSVLEKLNAFDAAHNVTSFCGTTWPIDDYYVATIIQIPNSTFAQYPCLNAQPPSDRFQAKGHESLIHASIYAVLREANGELKGPEPGRHLKNGMRNVEELTRVAAENFMHTPGIFTEPRYAHPNMFERLNIISSIMYEGTKSLGRMLLVNPENSFLCYLIKFAQPVPFNEHRWVRKILQMATADFSIIADSQRIYGLGRLKDNHDGSLQDVFTIDFLDHYHWELRCGSSILLRCHYGEPKLPQEPFEKSSFMANYKRLFPQSELGDAAHIWEILNAQLRLEHGSMIVVAKDAEEEAKRLLKQGTGIVPTKFTAELLNRVSGIDGTILLDTKGLCHAIGVILDGEANNDCTPSRGSRYNSAVRYVKQNIKNRFAIVVSEDRTADIIPELRPLLSKALIEKHIIALEAATGDNYYEPRKWLDTYRFYLNAKNCERVNAALSRIDNLPREVGRIYFTNEQFQPDPQMEENYLID